MNRDQRIANQPYLEEDPCRKDSGISANPTEAGTLPEKRQYGERVSACPGSARGVAREVPFGGVCK